MLVCTSWSFCFRTEILYLHEVENSLVTLPCPPLITSTGRADVYMLAYPHSLVVQRSSYLKPAVPFEREGAFPLFLHVVGWVWYLQQSCPSFCSGCCTGGFGCEV